MVCCGDPVVTVVVVALDDVDESDAEAGVIKDREGEEDIGSILLAGPVGIFSCDGDGASPPSLCFAGMVKPNTTDPADAADVPDSAP